MMLAYILLLVTFLDEIIGSIWMPKPNEAVPPQALMGAKEQRVETQPGNAEAETASKRAQSLRDSV